MPLWAHSSRGHELGGDTSWPNASAAGTRVGTPLLAQQCTSTKQQYQSLPVTSSSRLDLSSTNELTVDSR